MMIEEIKKVCDDSMFLAACYLLGKGRLSPDDADEAHRHLMKEAREGNKWGRLAASWYLAGEGFLGLGPQYKLEAIHCHVIANEHLLRAQKEAGK